MCLSDNSHHATDFMYFPTEALANRRHLRGVLCLAMCCGVMSGSESVPLRKVLKRCMLFRQCCEAHIHRNPAKQSSLAKVYIVWRCVRFIFSDAVQNIVAKNFFTIFNGLQKAKFRWIIRYYLFASTVNSNGEGDME